MKLDILAFGAHPDDVELCCGGTLIKHVNAGKKVGIIDLTRGEMGTRGTAEERVKESAAAAAIIGASVRENLGLRDGFLSAENEKDLLAVIRVLRKYRPDVVIANAKEDRHPDHGRGSALVSRAVFLSGLVKIETSDNGVEQHAWRPGKVYHYMQYRYRKPDFVVDISDVFERRKEAILAYSSQFYDPDSNEPETLISTSRFQNFLESRAKEYGSIIEKEYGEGFETDTPLELDYLI